MRILYLPSQYSQQRQREKRRWIYPMLLAMQAQYYRNLGHEVSWDWLTYPMSSYHKVIEEPEDIDFLKLPPPDRIFTNAFDKKYQENGNFKYHPATYIQVANGCAWGRCEFCVEKKNKYQVRELPSVIDEINECERLGFVELFDDSGTFPTGKWLEDFCNIYKWHKLKFGCNFRMIDADYKLMKQAGFRMILMGLESANNDTLKKINKGTRVSDIKYIKKAAEAGLSVHIAVMVGYPWESDRDAMNTIKLAHWLLKKGYAKTAQASFYMPPDGKNNPSQRKYVKKLYDVKWNPEFLFNQLKDIKDWNDVKYLWKKILASIQK